MKALLYIVTALFFIGCASRQEKAHQYFDSHRGELAEKCDKEFPNDTIRIVKGIEVVKRDTVTLPGIVIECPEPTEQGKPVYVKCPETKTVTVTKERTDTIVITDTQKTKALEYKLKVSDENLSNLTVKYNTVQSKYESERKAKRTYLWALIALAVLVTGYMGIKIIK